MLNQNGIGIRTQALIDTGANGFIFIDTKLAQTIQKHFGLLSKNLPNPCSVQGFDGREADLITQYLEISLLIDRHQQRKLPMLIVGLGDKEMILGRA